MQGEHFAMEAVRMRRVNQSFFKLPSVEWSNGKIWIFGIGSFKVVGRHSSG